MKTFSFTFEQMTHELCRMGMADLLFPLKALFILWGRKRFINYQMHYDCFPEATWDNALHNACIAFATQFIGTAKTFNVPPLDYGYPKRLLLNALLSSSPIYEEALSLSVRDITKKFVKSLPDGEQTEREHSLKAYRISTKYHGGSRDETFAVFDENIFRIPDENILALSDEPLGQTREEQLGISEDINVHSDYGTEKEKLSL